MPRDSSGSYALPEAPFVVNTDADPAKVNNNFSDLATAASDSLSRTGQGGMLADLPMGNHKVVGMVDGTAATDGATYGQVAARIPRDGSAPMTGDFDAGGHVLKRASGLQVGLADGQAPEGTAHVRASDLAVALGSVATVVALQCNSGVVDELHIDAGRTAAGGGAATMRWAIGRVVAGVAFGGLWLAGDGSAALVANGGPLVTALPDGTVEVCGQFGAINLGNATSGYGVKFLPFTAGAGVALMHLFRGTDPGVGELMRMRRDNQGAYITFTSSTGSVQGSLQQSVGGGVSLVSSSDARLKQDVVDLPSALAKVATLRAVEFAWRAHPDMRVAGFIAGEVGAVIPDAVIGLPDAVDEHGVPIYQQMDPGRLIPVLWAAVRELAAQVAALRAGP